MSVMPIYGRIVLEPVSEASRHGPALRGIAPSARTLLPCDGAGLGTPRFQDWFKRGTAQASRPDSSPVAEVSHA